MSWSEQARAAAGERMPERHRLGIIAQSLGPEVRARMSAARKKAWSDPEVRARMSAASKKALSDPEVRARMSAARKKAWSDPEVRARMSAARKKALSDPEVRARMEKSAGWLTGAERAVVVEEIRSGRRYIDIAEDWLLTTGSIARIAKQEGLQRRPRTQNTCSRIGEAVH